MAQVIITSKAKFALNEIAGEFGIHEKHSTELPNGNFIIQVDDEVYSALLLLAVEKDFLTSSDTILHIAAEYKKRIVDKII